MSAPPNHNPEASLLQGGSAPITPMAGGGGSEGPPGYNPDASALPVLGGSSQTHIQPLKGGATTLADAAARIAASQTPLSSGFQTVANLQKGATTLTGTVKSFQTDPLGALTDMALTSLTASGPTIVAPAPPPTVTISEQQKKDAMQKAALDAAMKVIAQKETTNRTLQKWNLTPSDVTLQTKIDASHKAFDELEKEIKRVPNNESLMTAFKRARDAKRQSDIKTVESIGTLRVIDQTPSSDESFVSGSFTMAPLKELFRKVNYEPVTLESRIFHIRKPDEAGYVQGDWVDGKYTKDESSFLNAMNLTKPMMTELFGDSWTQSVAIFLRGITTTSCYTDVNLITKSDCQTVRYFLEKIYYWFLQHPLAS